MQTPPPFLKAQHRAAASCGAAARPRCSALPVVCVWSAVLRCPAPHGRRAQLDLKRPRAFALCMRHARRPCGALRGRRALAHLCNLQRADSSLPCAC